MQLIFGIFCVVFGATVVFMKKEQIQDLLVMGKRYQYEDKLDRLDKLIIIFRLLSGLVGLVGLYICGIYLYYLVVGI